MKLITYSSVFTVIYARAPQDNYDHMDGKLMDKDEKSNFDSMTETDKKYHLTQIFKKVDVNDDGLLTQDELERWMEIVTDKYLSKDVENQWPGYDRNHDNYITWDEYNTSVFSQMSDEDFEDQNMSLEQMRSRDERRFLTADQDADGKLSKVEFSHFLHPEDFDHMKPIVIKETLEDLDLNGDGFIDEEEYIKDIFDHEEAGEEKPDWLDIEHEHFKTIRDLNRDGKLDEEEVKNWLMPIDYDHIVVESQHLIDEADKNSDNMLSLEEVLNDYELWMTSQATNWGEALSYHDEL